MTLTVIYDAKCKDCFYMRYYYNGNRKLHKCVLKDMQRTLKDKCCDKFTLNKEYYPQKI